MKHHTPAWVHWHCQSSFTLALLCINPQEWSQCSECILSSVTEEFAPKWLLQRATIMRFIKGKILAFSRQIARNSGHFASTIASGLSQRRAVWACAIHTFNIVTYFASVGWGRDGFLRFKKRLLRLGDVPLNDLVEISFRLVQFSCDLELPSPKYQHPKSAYFTGGIRHGWLWTANSNTKSTHRICSRGLTEASQEMFNPSTIRYGVDILRFTQGSCIKCSLKSDSSRFWAYSAINPFLRRPKF